MSKGVQLLPGERMRAFYRRHIAAETSLDAEAAERLVEALTAATNRMLVWEMPAEWIGGASIKGVLTAANILLIIFGAIALYYSMRESGAVRRISSVIINLNPDRRVQVSLAWFIAAFVEGIAGFGTPGPWWGRYWSL